jgi:opacity protein-like surface antigen
MFKLNQFALAACAWLVFAGPPALAADMPQPIPMAPPVVGGWYLRGDIGYKIWSDPEVDWDDSGAGIEFDDEDLDDTFMIGVGAGYRFNEWFRTDVTLDYEFPADFEGSSPCPAPCGGAGATVNSEIAEISAWTTLANVYLDLGNYSGFSPYVGAGAGVALVMVDDIVTEDSSTGTFTSIDGDEEWNFAWALMAGLAYDFTPQMTVDLGYRYLNLGEVSSDTVPLGAGDGDFTYDDLQAHEIRVGLRYTIF